MAAVHFVFDDDMGLQPHPSRAFAVSATKISANSLTVFTCRTKAQSSRIIEGLLFTMAYDVSLSMSHPMIIKSYKTH